MECVNAGTVASGENALTLVEA